MNRDDLIRRAAVAFLEYGRGAVVILLDDPEPIDVRADEAVQQLSEWQAEPALIRAMARATASSDAEHEANVVREDAIGLTVSIERDEVEDVVGPVSNRARTRRTPRSSWLRLRTITLTASS